MAYPRPAGRAPGSRGRGGKRPPVPSGEGEPGGGSSRADGGDGGLPCPARPVPSRCPARSGGRGLPRSRWALGPGPAPPRGYGGSVGGRLPPRSARRGGSAGSGGTGRPTPGRGAAGRSPGRGGPGAAAPVRRLAAPPPGPGGRATRLPSRLASPAWRWKPSLQQTPSGSERNATARPAAFGP